MKLADIFTTTLCTAPPAVTGTDDDRINLLIAMDDTEVRKQVGECFKAQMRNSPSVQGTFFSSAGPAPAPPPNNNDWIGDVASALVAWSLAQTSQHGFAACANVGNAKTFVQQKLDPSFSGFGLVAASNYDALFPTYCSGNGVTFKTFLDDHPDIWGQKLADKLVDQSFAAKEVLTFDADPGAFYQKLYLLFYKVKRLNSNQSKRVVDFWDNLLKDKAPHGPWTIYEYMQANKFSDQTFMPEVQTAINQSQVTGHTTHSYCQGGPAAHCTNVDVPSEYTYGAAVASWLSSHRQFNFITGTSPSNVEKQSGGGGCCFTKGTPVLLADGSSKAIENVVPGDAIFGRDGVVVYRSSQDVIWDLEENELLYGINEYPPFFNASHPFLTKDGWKAISPAAARRINPDLDIRRLEVGDLLYQIESTDPFRYREVEIQEITSFVGSPNEKIYSIHLHRENVGYHANGFCVAVNYPQITEDSFVRMFARLTSSERMMIRERLAPLMPLFKFGMGNFVQQALERSLADQ